MGIGSPVLDGAKNAIIGVTGGTAVVSAVQAMPGYTTDGVPVALNAGGDYRNELALSVGATFCAAW